MEDWGGVSNPQKPLEFVCVTLTKNYKGYGLVVLVCTRYEMT